MRRVPLLLALVSCGPVLDPPSTEGSGGRPAVLVRVATWNVHDLFDETDRLVPPGDADAVPSPAEVDAKLSRVAAVLVRLDADLVLLQEVENGPILRRLADRAGYPEARLVEGPDPRGIDVAVLSRIPLDAYVSHLGETDTSGRPLWPRDCVEVHARASGRPLVLVGSHFSSPLSDGGARRAAQAARLREIADALRDARPAAVVLAGGDLNDAPGSAALVPLLGDGAWRDPAPAGAVTWVGPSGAERLDYLLVPGDDAGRVQRADVVAGADVAAASDHRPLVVDLRLP